MLATIFSRAPHRAQLSISMPNELEVDTSGPTPQATRVSIRFTQFNEGVGSPWTGQIAWNTARPPASVWQLVEVAGQGIDTIRAGYSIALPAAATAEIENPVLVGTGTIDGTGNELANAITGNAAANHLYGLASNHTLDGGGGSDTLDGGAGDDSYIVGNAGVTLVDGSGSDTLHGEEEVDILFGDADADLVYGGTGSDVIMGERGGVSATGGNDTLYGDLDSTSLAGGADTIDGDGGDDQIFGGNGNDAILGDNGNDTIEGGAGAEIIGGSAASLAGIETTGSDTFVYRAMTDAGDSIYGFDVRGGDNDMIDLRPLFDALGYAGSAPRADVFLQVVQSGANVLVQVDANGSTGGASFTTLATLVDRTAADVVDGYFLFQ